MADKAVKVYGLCEPALTDALEFTDGKLMLGKHGTLRDITWERVKDALGGAAAIAEIVSRCHLFGMENWTMIPHMSAIWEGLINEVFPLMKTGASKPLAFFDLADPEKRTKDDILNAMVLIGRFGERFNAILGLNEKELYEIADVFGVDTTENRSLARTMPKVYERLGVYCLVVHPVKEAACCIGGEYCHVDGPFCERPVLTTGAGDNFNAGFCLGQALSLGAEDSLLLGVCTSGYYVRHAKSPTFEQVITFIGDWDSGNTL
jgi:hypothetical protein